MVELLLNPSDQAMQADPYGNFLFVDKSLDLVGEIAELHQRYAARAVAAYGGRTRNVFALPGGYVVKLPKNEAGMVDNDWEGAIEENNEIHGIAAYVQYPRTRLAHFHGIPVLFMAKVKPLTSLEIVDKFGVEPDWVMAVDGGQVGTNRQGRLVAYDFGLN